MGRTHLLGRTMKPRLLDLFEGDDGRIDARFSKYVPDAPAGACWEWTGSRRQNGYGQLNVSRYPYKAHRLAYFIHHGAFDESLHVLHSCDNPPCVNPNHLFLGTQADNMGDCAAKGRYARQLSTAQRAVVIALFDAGLSRRAIARQTGLSRRSVGRIVSVTS